MSQERHRFYVGVKDCGCITATLVDDSITKPKEIADFAREMQKTNRRVEHREMTLDEFKDVFKRCKCEPSNTRLDDTAAAIDAARAPADSVTAPAGGAVAEPEFDDCPASPTGKHSATWFANGDCEHCKSGAQPDAPLLYTPTPPAQAADSVLEDAARLERERICAAIKAEDDYCVDHGDYMLDSDDCIKIVRGEWVRPDFSVTAARKQGANHD